jgi:ubiquitin-protein ligase
MDQKDLYQWYFLIDGISGTVLEGGKYYGRITFPKEYPHKPPAVFIDTPNGVVTSGESICLSISEYHPETWDPAIGPRSIVLSLFVFLEDCLNGTTASAQSTYGVSDEQKIAYARASKQNNMRDLKFTTFFPEIVQQWTNEAAPATKVEETAVTPELEVKEPSDEKKEDETKADVPDV